MTQELKAPKLNGWLDGLGGNAQRQTRWLTPKPIVEALGDFDLDPCGAPDHKLAKRTYLLESGQDGLALDWEGRVWLNPPYGKEAEPFLKKLGGHGRGTALIFARTETKSFHEHVWGTATAILFLLGRVTFLDSEGVPARANSGAPSCLVAYGADDAVALADSDLDGQLVWLDEFARVKALEERTNFLALRMPDEYPQGYARFVAEQHIDHKREAAA